jgi:hypothetical protein
MPGFVLSSLYVTSVVDTVTGTGFSSSTTVLPSISFLLQLLAALARRINMETREPSKEQFRFGNRGPSDRKVLPHMQAPVSTSCIHISVFKVRSRRHALCSSPYFAQQHFAVLPKRSALQSAASRINSLQTADSIEVELCLSKK